MSKFVAMIALCALTLGVVSCKDKAADANTTPANNQTAPANDNNATPANNQTAPANNG